MPTSRTGTWNRAFASLNQRGFTLAELAIVVFLIALLSLLTIPNLADMGGSDLKAAGRRLAGTVKYLYNEAALEGLNYRLTLDLDSDLISASRQNESGEWQPVAGRFKSVPLPGDVRLHGVYLAGRGSFSTGSVQMQIYPQGWLDEAVLHLQDGNNKMTVTFSALTGTAEFFDGHREFRK